MPVRFTTPLEEGVFGFFLSPGKSLFLYAPIVVVAIFGLRLSYLKHRRYAITVGALLVAHLAIYARYEFWSGDDAFGPRYILPFVPLLIALIAPVLALGPQWKRGVKVAAVIGFLIPGLLGSVMYFRAVTIDQYAQVEQNAGRPLLTFVDQQNVWNFQPRSSPLVQSVQSLPALFESIGARFSGEPDTAGPFPRDTYGKVLWYAKTVQPDFWWWWWHLKGGTAWIYPLLAIPIAILGAGVMLLRRSWESPESGQDMEQGAATVRP